ncbi:hypothetical protein V6Z12_A02G151500 [Gossypium hirsutum]
MNSQLNLNLSFFVWNCQGCANTKFPCIFREYNMDFRLDIIGLLEPKVSGRKADDIIAKLGFQHSHRIEAKGWVKTRRNLGILESTRIRKLFRYTSIPQANH